MRCHDTWWQKETKTDKSDEDIKICAKYLDRKMDTKEMKVSRKLSAVEFLHGGKTYSSEEQQP